MPPIKVVVIEDHEMTRSGIVFSLKKLSEYDIVGEANNGQAGYDLVTATQPNVVLMDLVMPVIDGIEATKRLKKDHSHIKVIMLTSHYEKDQVFAALSSGADAYCIKDIATEDLIDVIRMVNDGACWLDPQVASLVLTNLRNTMQHRVTDEPGINDLTTRELEILKLLARGMNNQQIADTLTISVNTVKTHFTSILQKLAVDDRTQAALKALRCGIVSLQSPVES